MKSSREICVIRHGESEGNIGLPTDMPASIRLTERGHRQAVDVAGCFTQAPDLIVTSPYVRTQQTAAPLLARYPWVPMEIWPVHEFTYLNPLKYAGTTQNQRGEFARSYWRQCDPHWNDGDGAESFVDFVGRIDDLLARLAVSTALSLVAFTHGYFIKGLQLRLANPRVLVDAALMAAFRDGRKMNLAANGEVIRVPWGGLDGAARLCECLAAYSANDRP